MNETGLLHTVKGHGNDTHTIVHAFDAKLTIYSKIIIYTISTTKAPILQEMHHTIHKNTEL